MTNYNPITITLTFPTKGSQMSLKNFPRGRKFKLKCLRCGLISDKIITKTYCPANYITLLRSNQKSFNENKIKTKKYKILSQQTGLTQMQIFKYFMKHR